MNSEMEKVIEAFKKHFQYAPVWVSRAPGRLEILGNHTDYNQGTVLSVAVDRAMHVAAAPAPKGGTICRIYDLNCREERKFSLDNLASKVKGDWANYIKGILVEFQKRGIEVPAFDAALYGTVPLSAGMSSSAAMEMAVVKIIFALTGKDLGWLEGARIGQACENNYVGANTGLMDQLSSMMGKQGQLIYSDFRSFDVENVPMPEGTVFVVANSMVKHNLTGAYNERRQSCETAAAELGVPALRDVSWEQLLAAKDKVSPLPFKRALHVVGEITRVAQGRKLLEAGDLAAFGRLMSESHESSIKNFENSCVEIDELVFIGSRLPGFLGGRISGGGFGGIAVFLVKKENAAEFMAGIKENYDDGNGTEIQVLQCEASDGATIFSC